MSGLAVSYTRTLQPDPEVELTNGSKVEPVATLEDEYGGRAQIVVDDHCYILLLRSHHPDDKGRYKATPWIFKEAFEVLKTLPPPR